MYARAQGTSIYILKDAKSSSFFKKKLINENVRRSAQIASSKNNFYGR